MEAARWLCYRALWLRATGQPHTDLAAIQKRIIATSLLGKVATR